MPLPDWTPFALSKGILREATSDPKRIALWVPGRREGGFQLWERFCNVPGAAVSVEHGIAAVAASCLSARQKLRGVFGKLLPRFTADDAWILPNGESAEKTGEAVGLLLVWAEDSSRPIDEARLALRWSTIDRIQRVAGNLVVLFGADTTPTVTAPPPQATLPPVPRNDLPPPVNPREQAEQMLRAARAAGDRTAETVALTDLGHILLRNGDARGGLVVLEQALPLAREANVALGDVLGGLGMAATATSQPKRAMELFEEELALAQAQGDRYAEKTSLSHMGQAHTFARQFATAASFFEQALAIAHELGDTHDGADLLWFLAILNAEMGQRDRALSYGQVCLDILAATGNPNLALFADHLQRYRQGAADMPNSFTVPGVRVMGPSQAAAPPPSPGPNLLRQAYTAAKSMARYFRSGLKTVSAETHTARLEVCATCPHHTGVRCRLCGCFTNLKARLPHEDCPAGKWPQQA